MIKVVYCITKRQDLTDAEFFNYWRDVHGPIGAEIPRLRRLVQSHRVDGGGGPWPCDFDGVAELWFDSFEDLCAARASSQWQVSTEDEANFIDPAGTACFISQEHEIAIGGE